MSDERPRKGSFMIGTYSIPSRAGGMTYGFNITLLPAALKELLRNNFAFGAEDAFQATGVVVDYDE